MTRKPTTLRLVAEATTITAGHAHRDAFEYAAFMELRVNDLHEVIRTCCEEARAFLDEPVVSKRAQTRRPVRRRHHQPKRPGPRG